MTILLPIHKQTHTKLWGSNTWTIQVVNYSWTTLIPPYCVTSCGAWWPNSSAFVTEELNPLIYSPRTSAWWHRHDMMTFTYANSNMQGQWKIIFENTNMFWTHGSRNKPTTSSCTKVKETDISFNPGGENWLCIGFTSIVQPV